MCECKFYCFSSRHSSLVNDDVSVVLIKTLIIVWDTIGYGFICRHLTLQIIFLFDRSSWAFLWWHLLLLERLVLKSFISGIVLRLGFREDFKPFEQPSLDVSRSFSSRRLSRQRIGFRRFCFTSWWLSHQRVGAWDWSRLWWTWRRSDGSHRETHL